MSRHRIGLVVHQGRKPAVETAQIVQRWAAVRGIAVIPVDVWSSDGMAEPRRHAKEEAEVTGHPDLVVTIGGDGTFLRGARVAAVDNVAVLGVNVGRVGFLTEVEPTEVEVALEAFFSGKALIEERLVLGMTASRPLEIPGGVETLCFGRGPLLPPPQPRAFDGVDGPSGVDLDVMALNDIVFEKLTRDRQVSLGVHIDRELFASYSADALIVSSPTGSTAYNFAAGGPVLSPRMRALVFTPVAPHMVFNRSIVLAADEAIAVRVLDRSGQVAVSVDGQLRGVVDPGDWVSVHAPVQRVRLVRLRQSNFYARLRQRFALADAPAAVADSARRDPSVDRAIPPPVPRGH
jgi:NAD+ kinase